jgi:hypothetical protein
VMSENWALIFSESDLLSAPPEGPIPATLVVYSEMKDLSQYQSRLSDLQALPGLVDRIQQVRDSVRQENPGSTPEPLGVGVGPGSVVSTTPTEGGGPTPPPITLPGITPPPSG